MFCKQNHFLIIASHNFFSKIFANNVGIYYLCDCSNHNACWLFTIRIRYGENFAKITEYLSTNNKDNKCKCIVNLHNEQANFKKIVMPPTCIWCIVCDSINWPDYLVLSPFDLYIGSRLTRVMGFDPADFRLHRPFHSQVKSRYMTDRHQPSFYNRPSLRRLRHNKHH